MVSREIASSSATAFAELFSVHELAELELGACRDLATTLVPLHSAEYMTLFRVLLSSSPSFTSLDGIIQLPVDWLGWRLKELDRLMRPLLLWLCTLLLSFEESQEGLLDTPEFPLMNFAGSRSLLGVLFPAFSSITAALWLSLRLWLNASDSGVCPKLSSKEASALSSSSVPTNVACPCAAAKCSAVRLS